MTGRDLWNMKLFEEKVFKGWLILRVPGGWVIREYSAPNAAYVFVPLNNEFLED